jgi:Skp family chaperone for outer membrane proteins
MKKTVLIALVALFMAVPQMKAQRDRQQMDPTAMAAERAERLAKDMSLEGDVKTKFVDLYKKYQEELTADIREQMEARKERTEEKKKDKDLTDEEALARINEQFEQEQQQISNQQKQLMIKKNYLAEFREFLTPQQLLKVFGRGGRNRGNNNNNNNGGDRMGGPGMGGPGGGPGGFGGGPGF